MATRSRTPSWNMCSPSAGSAGSPWPGAETDACVRSTLHGAFTRGYDVALVSDAHTAGDKTHWGAPPVDAVIAHTNLYWAHQSAPGRTAEVVTAAELRLTQQRKMA
ncbi:hypothetical protein FHR72_002373 [Mycolicibacterium iranicum]|uniref:Isochorismatase-like domain-containing protein n=1 Tax=Mycolicibacterium iranicum TaxID=912594 RepID=A0A839Q488_MYCIR|nr:isochorismatase family protein [Mycolicibacterium iranicum]MBB2990900.1 hypothetical protein [Mycolicibacterium iranicum]